MPEPGPPAPGVTPAPGGTRVPIGADLDLLLAAARAVTARRSIGPGSLQRGLRVGFAKADRLVLLLEQEGLIARVGARRWTCLIRPGGLDAALDRIRKAGASDAGGS